MCRYMTRGDSRITWLCSADISTPPSSSLVSTGVTSSSVSTRSPITIVMSPVFLKATHEPRASAGLSSIPPTVTFKSLRGRLTLYTSPGCIEPALPKACSIGFQSMADGVCAELVGEVPFCGAEHAASTKIVRKTAATVASMIRLSPRQEIICVSTPFDDLDLLISGPYLSRVEILYKDTGAYVGWKLRQAALIRST